jgi:thiamine-monophosphate kinase
MSPGPSAVPSDALLTVGEAGEHQVIAHVRAQLPPPPDWVVVGIGDDAAVIERSRNQLDVLTTDALVEGVHFDRRFVDPGSIGFRALAVNLSDLAAMGAAPRVALLSLGLPASLPLADLDAMIGGLVELAVRHHVTLVGGNVTRSPGPLFVDVTLTGTAKRRKVLTRAGGRPGDELFVTGTLGAAAAGLAWLRTHGLPGEAAAIPEVMQSAVLRYLRPEPRLRFGMIAGRTRAASACMDLSDGLADAVRQLAAASGAGARVDLDLLPIDPAATHMFGHLADGPALAAIGAGDDYELLCAVPRRAGRRFAAAARASGLAITRVGALTPESVLVLRRDGQDHEWPAGFEHFQS